MPNTTSQPNPNGSYKALHQTLTGGNLVPYFRIERRRLYCAL